MDTTFIAPIDLRLSGPILSFTSAASAFPQDSSGGTTMRLTGVVTTLRTTGRGTHRHHVRMVNRSVSRLGDLPLGEFPRRLFLFLFGGRLFWGGRTKGGWRSPLPGPEAICHRTDDRRSWKDQRTSPHPKNPLFVPRPRVQLGEKAQVSISTEPWFDARTSFLFATVAVRVDEVKWMFG
jgi:hypothetical protein